MSHPSPQPQGKVSSRRYQRAVADADGLSRRCKTFLLGLVTFIDWTTGEARVSMSQIARAVQWGERAMQLAAREAETVGILMYPKGRRGGRRPDGTGIPNLLRVDLERLESMKGACRAPLKSAYGADEGRTPEQSRAHPEADKGARGAPTINIHPNPGEQRHPKAENGTAFRRVDGMDGRHGQDHVRALLTSLGIGGPNLDRLMAVPALTGEVVRREWASIATDPNVRNKPAVLMARLKRAVGLSIPERRRLSPEVRKLQTRIEELRRRPPPPQTN